MAYSRAQKIVDLLEKAAEEVKDYQKQSLPEWRQAILKGVYALISAGISIMRGGFSEFLLAAGK